MKTRSIVYIASLLTSISLQSQYSNYYRVNSDVNVSGTVNNNLNVSGTVNNNLNVSGTVNKNVTVKSIDYGALASANAQREANRLSLMRYENEQAKFEALAIAEQPSRAFDYGEDVYWALNEKSKGDLGWGRAFKTMYHKKPHESLFLTTLPYTYENISEEGVKTKIIINGVFTLAKIRETRPNYKPNFEDKYSFEHLQEGKLQDINSNGFEDSFLHKKAIRRSSVFGVNGFRGTLIWEDKYDKGITDNYGAVRYAEGKTYVLNAQVLYSGNKEDITFEQLEGRRYYFRLLIDKMISTAKIF
jgi:hypothetical protein